MAAFPTLTSKPDSSQFSYEREDPAMRTEIEGGYVISRPRHTRTPRKTWNVAYTFISHADKNLIDAFWDTTRGGADIFDWTNPEDNVVYQVRFVDKISFTYRGRGTTKRWDVSFRVEQA